MYVNNMGVYLALLHVIIRTCMLRIISPPSCWYYGITFLYMFVFLCEQKTLKRIMSLCLYFICLSKGVSMPFRFHNCTITSLVSINI